MKKFFIFSLCIAMAGTLFPGSLAAQDRLVGEAETDGSTTVVRPLPELSIFYRSIARNGITTAIREVSETRFPHLDLGSPAYIYHVSTTADLGGITVCLLYDPARFEVPLRAVQLAQIEDDGSVRLITHTYADNFVCGSAGHLSSFAAVQNFGVSPLAFTRSQVGNGTVLSFGAPVTPSVSALSNRHAPHGVRAEFLSVSGNGVLTITNGSVPATGARVLLNGEVVGSGSLFKKHQNGLSAPVGLLPGLNSLEVSVDGGPGSGFTLSIARAR